MFTDRARWHHRKPIIATREVHTFKNAFQHTITQDSLQENSKDFWKRRLSSVRPLAIPLSTHIFLLRRLPQLPHPCFKCVAVPPVAYTIRRTPLVCFGVRGKLTINSVILPINLLRWTRLCRRHPRIVKISRDSMTQGDLFFLLPRF